MQGSARKDVVFGAARVYTVAVPGQNGNPGYKRKWKGSTALTTEHRIRSHLIAEFRERTLDSFTRDELQGLLERKAASGLSFSTVDHLRWDLKLIFKMAWEDGYLPRTPAALLFTPQEAGLAPEKAHELEGGGTMLVCT